MIDSLVSVLEKIDQFYEELIFQKFGLRKNQFVLVTLHRPSNVDDKIILWQIMNFLNTLSLRIPAIFPVHPRTRKNINGFDPKFIPNEAFKIIEPLRYKEFITLEKYSKFVLTDSGGIQEESTYLKVPCLTLRANSERPITIIMGTNELVTIDTIEDRIESILSGSWKQGEIPPLWDGKTGQRIIAIFKNGSFRK